MGYRVITAEAAHWRPSNQMQVDNTNIGAQVGATTLGARFWRLRPGQTSTRHRHRLEHELYVLLEGTGRIRVDDDLLTLAAHDCVLVEPDSVRQVFNDTDGDTLWLIVGAPPEQEEVSTLSPPEVLAHYYPDGPAARPPELS